MGGIPFTPQIVIPGWTAGGVCALWVSEHPLWRTNIYEGGQLKISTGSTIFT